MAAPDSIPSKSPWWLESLVWSLAFVAAVALAAWLNETAREIVMQGLAYLFTFFSTPFVLEASTAFVGLCIVMAINHRRIEREGNGWVEMEIKQTAAEKDSAAGETEPSAKASEV